MLYAEIAAEQKEWLTRETEKMDYAFVARRRLIGKVGLPAVRTHRLARLDQEIAEWRRQSGLVQGGNALSDRHHDVVGGRLTP